LLLADNRVRFGILTLFRTAELGPFRSADIRTLIFALDAACDHLSEMRLMEAEFRRLSAWERECPVVDDIAYYILDHDLEIVLSWTTEHNGRFTSAAETPATQLPPLLAEAVRGLTVDWTDDPATHQPGMALPVPFLVLRTRPMAGKTGSFISVSVERLKPSHSLVYAAAHYRFSPRELQVLSLLLRGTSLDEIAQGLNISSSTVQDHVKRLIEKTRAGNRSEMIANVFRHNTPA
jgi:DNA-binding CsgD family transcriptional regulator